MVNLSNPTQLTSSFPDTTPHRQADRPLWPVSGSELEASVPGCAAGLFVAAGGGGAQDFGGSWRLGRGVFGALLLYAGLIEAESASLSKLEVGCCAGAESGGGQVGLGFAAGWGEG